MLRVNEKELERLLRAGIWALDIRVRGQEYLAFLATLIVRRERQGDLLAARRLREVRERFEAQRAVN